MRAADIASSESGSGDDWMLADALVGVSVLTCKAIYYQNMTSGSSRVHAQDEPKIVTRPLLVYSSENFMLHLKWEHMLPFMQRSVSLTTFIEPQSDEPRSQKPWGAHAARGLNYLFAGIHVRLRGCPVFRACGRR